MPAISDSVTKPPFARFEPAADGTVLLHLGGEWKHHMPVPSTDEVIRGFSSYSGIKRMSLDTSELTGWDSCLLAVLTRLWTECGHRSVALDQEGLPEGLRRLLRLATAVPERAGVRKGKARVPFLSRVGESAVAFWKGNIEMLTFLGEACVALTRFVTGRARFRRSELFVIMQECGAQALPIVSLISLLVGLILAFIGAIQLRIFGAQIYVASLVGIGMVRALAAVMTGIIMAGRTGASFAAQLGTMQVNEEVDALQTLGISPMEFLVLPRMIALFIMMPLLSLYADLMGVLGGLIIGVSMLDLNFMEYFDKTRESVTMNDFWVGLVSAAVFGVLVALAGCLRGMQCGRSASAVGEAATSAVVTSIVSIVVATAVITVVCDVLGI